MSIEVNKALVQRFYEDVLNHRSLEAVDELAAPDYRHHVNGRLASQGPEAYKRGLDARFKAWPDLRVTFEDVLAEGDKVICRGKVRGTHHGELLLEGMKAPVPPTGKVLAFEFMVIARLVAGRIAEDWEVCDISWYWDLVRASRQA